ncbi:hypothetical protein NLJ89_g11003 [Agrocybe chaxingu]|uniref:Nephrocystin 3-like N-terminal domain-containing protein n=1 Tax=Agrocybe chaxingu TaxID=84603 RepID=A0A9W8JXL0_9AGAR|nr:hypothetical protein NLJ89_g11003 [Agrocybe chaxingu]
MALSILHSRALIEAIIETDPLLFEYSLEVQLTRLVFEPLQRLFDPCTESPQPLPPLVVIDGFDECQDERAQSLLIEFPSSRRRRHTTPLKILIASRPEQCIKFSFNSVSPPSVVSFLEPNDDF